MKKILKIFAILFLFGSVLLSCDNDVPETDIIATSNDTEKDNEDETPELQKVYGVKFNFANAKAIAKLEASTGIQRSVTNIDELGNLVKILADGSMENAVSIDSNCSLSNIVAIYKSPVETSKDIFIEFSGTSRIGYESIKKLAEDTARNMYSDYYVNQSIQVGQLICIHEDGSIADILKMDDAIDSWNSHMSLRSGSVTFDKNGNLYFISSSNYGDGMICQFNPENDKLTKLVAAVEGTRYEKIQVDADGQWVFVSGGRSSSYFLRAIPVNNPDGFVNVFYSSNTPVISDLWEYDARNEKLYFIVNEGARDGLFTATKSGGFTDKIFLGITVGDGYVNELFETYDTYTEAYWKEEVKNSEGNFDSQKAVEKFLSDIPSQYDYKTYERKYVSLDAVDIRFENFLTESNGLNYIAKSTKGKKNKAAFEALDSEEGRGFLLSLYMAYLSQEQEGYEHNFLADILYIKDTDILLCNSDEILYEYTPYGETEPRQVRGTDLFPKFSNGNYKDSNRYCIGQIVGITNYTKEKACIFKPVFYDADNKFDSSKVLETIYRYCNVEGSKEFRLTEFKDDEIYGSLYSTLKNEDAVEWINSDSTRRNLFGDYSMSMKKSDETSVSSDNYFRFMNMISKTCFIAGTNQKATTWNCSNNTSIRYYYPYRLKLSVRDTGVYYEFNNSENSYVINTNPYYYIVQVADKLGNIAESVNMLSFISGKVVKTEKNKDILLLQYSMMNEAGAELGYHNIYAVDMASGKVYNCFDNVPNRNFLEVISFNLAGDLLYFSAVYGTSVENGVINIKTNEYKPLTVQRKMLAVYSFD